MNRTFALVTALAAGMTSAAGMAQTAGTPAPAATPPATAPARSAPPQAVPAKIAVIEFEQATAATNEGQRALQTLQKKYEPQKTQLQALQTEIESLTKQLQSAPTTMSDEERASRQRTIETKQKQLQRDGEDATNAFNAEMQDTLGSVEKKLGPVVVKYVQDNGYTMLLDNSGQQGGLSLLWLQQGTDISQAVVDAYNASSGVAAPAVPSAPSATRPHPTTTTPAKPPVPKQ
jgi:outer membrane protein